ncbi:MAG: hypothetical protein AAF694_07930 [Bacteroidota bacterium]
MKTLEGTYLTQCKHLIEKQYPVGLSTGKLMQRDFEYLSEQIEEKSGLRISISTLKRIWREDYQSVPHPATLNALAALLGFENWQDFIQTQNAGIHQEELPLPLPNIPSSPKPKWMWVAALGALALFTSVFLLGNGGSTFEGIEISSPISFSANKTVDQGLPNTVIFEYDLSGVTADSFFFQQAWDETYKEPIDPLGKYHNSIYYYPGFHKAKLIANDSILKIHRVHLLTEGWLPYLNNEEYTQIPRYLAQPKLLSGSFKVSQEEIMHPDINISKGFKLTYANMQDFKGLSSGNFYLESALRMDSSYYNPCPEIQVYVHSEVHIHKLAFSSKGCVRNVWIKLGEKYFNGQDEDLSALGTDLFNYQKVSLEVRDGLASIFLNEELAFQTSFKEDMGEIKGIDFRFYGLGEIDYVRMGPKKGDWTFQEEFKGAANLENSL